MLELSPTEVNWNYGDAYRISPMASIMSHAHHFSCVVCAMLDVSTFLSTLYPTGAFKMRRSAMKENEIEDESRCVMALKYERILCN